MERLPPRNRAVRCIPMMTGRPGVTFADGSSGTLDISARGPRDIKVTVTPDDVAGVTSWGVDTSLRSPELIYGLTERIVDSVVDSEIEPKEVGSLDRRGEVVNMFVTPTMSGYAPFYQSSAGYGLLVEGTMPGSYDIGAAQPDRLRFEFEFDPSAKTGAFDLLYGPTAPKILDAYTALHHDPKFLCFLHVDIRG